MARLSVCTTEATAWKDIVQSLTSEAFDRNVIWICKYDPAMVKNYKLAGSRKGVDERLLLSAWEGSKVSLRLLSFHVGFLHLLARPNGVSPKAVVAGFAALYGMPSAYLKRQIQGFIKTVINTDYNWPFFFKTMGLQCPSKEHLTGWLGQCWKNALQKMYHEIDTVFENIQKRGVSTILLKGESYTTPVNMKSLKMLEIWRWSTFATEYLHASCFLYDFDGRFVEVIDYGHRGSNHNAVTHSGDVLDHHKQQGRHVIEIDLKSTRQECEGIILYHDREVFDSPLCS